MNEHEHHNVEHHEEEVAPIVENKTVIVESQPRRDLFLPISILAAAFMIGGAILFATLYRGGSAPSGNTGTGNNGAATTTVNTAAAMTLGSRDAILGNANAKVTLVEYGDYQCPFCAQFFSQTEPQIIQNYVSTGKVRMVFRDYAFLGPESIAAAEAAQCAEDQNKLWVYHDALYSAKVADEGSGGGENDGFYNRAEFVKLAQQTGLDVPTFTSCIDTHKDAAIVTQEKASGTTYGINSTPSFLINGTAITGAQPYNIFQQALDAALNG
jgi:protein-disulfide isomerase